MAPGHLLSPLGWAAEPVARLLELSPGMLRQLLELSRPRMHVLALALAHLPPDRVPNIGAELVVSSARQVLRRVLGRCPVGINRAVGVLPSAVLQPESYRRLVQLLEDPAAGRLVHHADGRLDDCAIAAIHGVPAALRPAAFAVCEDPDELDGLADGLRLLAARGAAPSFEALVADLAQHRQPGQFVAKLRALVAGLPVPECLPPARIGNSRRLDSGNDIKRLASTWRNCLSTYVDQVDNGRAAVYLWDDPAGPAACHVIRCGRLGWVLNRPLGPKNTEIEPSQLAAIWTAFAAAGVAQARGAYAIEQIVVAAEWGQAAGPHLQGPPWRRARLPAAWQVPS